MSDIVGTPVERKIPEGWHVVRNGLVGSGDVLGADKEWRHPSDVMLSMHTDSDGFIWHAMEHFLVIRRNAPEKPSVERVIPDGWHVLRGAQAHASDLMECSGLWVPVGSFAGHPTSVDGRIGGSLVIRRNAPVEPSVEEMRRERDEWKSAAEINARSVDRLIGERDKLKAKVAELEEDLSNANHDGNRWRDTYSATITEVRRLEDAVRGKDAELVWSRDQCRKKEETMTIMSAWLTEADQVAKGERVAGEHLFSRAARADKAEKEVATLEAKVADLEKANLHWQQMGGPACIACQHKADEAERKLDAKDAEIEVGRKERDEWRSCCRIQEDAYAKLKAKLNAAKKALEGA